VFMQKRLELSVAIIATADEINDLNPSFYLTPGDNAKDYDPKSAESRAEIRRRLWRLFNQTSSESPDERARELLGVLTVITMQYPPFRPRVSFSPDGASLIGEGPRIEFKDISGVVEWLNVIREIIPELRNNLGQSDEAIKNILLPALSPPTMPLLGDKAIADDLARLYARLPDEVVLGYRLFLASAEDIARRTQSLLQQYAVVRRHIPPLSSWLPLAGGFVAAFLAGIAIPLIHPSFPRCWAVLVPLAFYAWLLVEALLVLVAASRKRPGEVPSWP
jgi:hypothetical protein